MADRLLLSATDRRCRFAGLKVLPVAISRSGSVVPQPLEGLKQSRRVLFL
jgi:hypothetical protein